MAGLWASIPVLKFHYSYISEEFEDYFHRQLFGREQQVGRHRDYPTRIIKTLPIYPGSDFVHHFVALHNYIKANPNAFFKDLFGEDEEVKKQEEPTQEYRTGLVWSVVKGKCLEQMTCYN